NYNKRRTMCDLRVKGRSIAAFYTINYNIVRSVARKKPVSRLTLFFIKIILIIDILSINTHI
ncbi:MAG: hypothetical protein OEZ22_14570, partial [Spirochaetia bacterium]|nr:hypothetical protein [Spirochaetia bacterium]